MDTKWSIIKRAGFIFLFSYVVLYANSIQFVFSFLTEPIWKQVIPWFASTIGYEGTMPTAMTGSGDTSYDFYRIIFFAIIAFIATLVVLIVDRKRQDYNTLARWLMVLIRYYLAAQMINYGLAKIFYLQFSFPSAARLDQPLGDFSPMGLLWTFMGYSRPFTMFTGFLEFGAGILLLSRYTTTLGALMTFGVMLNVMMMNYSYDVPVKLLSSHMVFMSLVLVYMDRMRLLKFFVWQKQVTGYLPIDIVPNKYVKPKTIAKWVVLGGYLFYSLFQINKMGRQYGPNAIKPVFHGKHQITEFELFRDSFPVSALEDSMKWAALYQRWEGFGMISTVDDREIYVNIQPDTSLKTLKLKLTQDTTWSTLRYLPASSSEIMVEGRFLSDSLRFKMKKTDINKHLLVNRGFHWINERPFNR